MAGEHPGEQAIFESARQIQEEAAREAFLAAACGADVALRERVGKLLGALNDSASFLESPPTAVASVAQTARQAPPTAPELRFLRPPTDLQSLGRLDHYHILEIVGCGGFGVVLKARDEKLQRIVAVKTLAESLAASGAARQRFVREAQAAAAVRHDNMVSIYAVDDAGNVPYLVMEFVDGVSLDDKLRRDGALPLKEILRISLQLAEGLAAAHKQGLVHRDVKPANILLENGVQRVKITDFGLARAADDASLTATGLIAGTPAYMSPEQARGDSIDPRSDLFSLGSVLYAMCTGQSPFRGSTTLGVIKRVCEEQPRPIRELNPDIPGRLLDLINKLHAKDPAERYQSAREVADLLSQHLAQPQQPADSKLVVHSAIRNPQSAIGRRWALPTAAAVLLLLLGISLTEATGVTQVASTVIRILTPEGTLVIEASDPDVKVTIEGDGGLAITTEGGQHVRLPAGSSYKLRAAKDGKPVPLNRDLVTITQGKEQVVKVRLEAVAAAAPAAQRGAFVVLGKGTSERKYDTLSEAVLGASDGDTIEIRGNGPFATEPLTIQNRSLTIRATDGFRPVIKVDPEERKAFKLLFADNSRLVLEGLDLQWTGVRPYEEAEDNGGMLVTVEGPRSALYVANCRFLMNRRDGKHWGMFCVASNSPLCHLKNCQMFIAGQGEYTGHAPDAWIQPGGRFVMDNCLIVAGGTTLSLLHTEPTKLVLSHNDFIGGGLHVFLRKKMELSGLEKELPPMMAEVSSNIFCHVPLVFDQHPQYLEEGSAWTAAEAASLLPKFISWRDRQNLYSLPDGSDLLCVGSNYSTLPLGEPIRTLTEWNHFWSHEALDSQLGKARFRGGDLLQKLVRTPELMLPDDFRLRHDSAGYRAGQDGKDLGADIDLVGPGAAYERWKKTAEYQQWLEETGQLTGKAAAEEQAFVILRGEGLEQVQFDTLAEAVRGAGDGDTIEIRGNGPFVEGPLYVARPLTIRAGASFHPTIELDSRKAGHLLSIDAPLTLEGIAFLHQSPGKYAAVLQAEAELHAANCRFAIAPRGPSSCVHLNGGPAVLRNCEFLRLGAGGGCGITYNMPTRGELQVENCVDAGWYDFLVVFFDVNKPQDVAIRVRHCTSAAEVGLYLNPSGLPLLPLAADAAPSPGLSFECSHNLFHFRRHTLIFGSRNPTRAALPPQSLRDLCGRYCAWREEKNQYSRAPLVGVVNNAIALQGAVTIAEGQTEWNGFWNLEATGSLIGEPKYQRGDVYALARTAGETVRAENFRLTADSPGYRGGQDGKDLGADVDLVGPGAAYERWKQTPEYQEWLNETGQKE